MWVVDNVDDKLYAYNLDTKARDAGKDFDTLSAAGNNRPRGIWSDETTMWVADSEDDKLYAYNLDTKARDAGKDFDTLSAAGNNNPNGIWSNGTTMWVADLTDAKLYAYRMSDKGRDARRDFDTLSAAGNTLPVGIWSVGATMWVTDAIDSKVYSYNMQPRSAPYGYPIRARLNVGQGWVGYIVDTHTLPCRQCFYGQAFVVNFENNRVYIVEVDTALDSKDPRLKNVQVMDFEGWNLTNGTMRKDRHFLSGRGYHYPGGQTNTIVDTRHWAIGGGDFFVYTRLGNGYDEATEEYRIRVRDVTGGSVRATSGTVQATSGTVQADSPQAVEPEPLAAAFAPPTPDSHGGSAFTMWLGFTEEVRITEKTLRAALSISGGQLTSVAQRDAGYNRNWNVTITPDEFQTVTINMPATSDCGAANAICTEGGKRLSEALTLAVPHYTIPRVTGATVDGGPGDNGAWDTDETATFAVQFNKAVTVSGLPDNEPTLGILVGGTRREAEFTGGSGSDTLTFSHRVTSEDAGTTNIEVVDNGIALDGIGIADSHSQAAVLTFDYYTYLSTTAPPIRALFRSLPASHGESGFTFELAFSEEPTGLSYLTLRGNDENPGVLSVANGEIDAVRRLESGGSRRWEITITPSGADPVTITLPANGDCAATGAICKNARPLAAPVTATVAPQAAPENTAATGQPTISGTAQVGETLTAETSGIADTDGLSNVTYSYQWISNDGTADTDILDATASSYTVVSADRGKTIKVSLSFRDDAGNDETLTSEATSGVSEPPLTSLAVSPGTLTPSFRSHTQTYTAPDLANTDNRVTLTTTTVEGYNIIFAKAYSLQTQCPVCTLIFQDISGNDVDPLTDADADAEGFQVDLAVGYNSIVMYVYEGGVGTGDNEIYSVRVTRASNTLAAGAPTISGTAQVGQTLTASTSRIGDMNGLTNVSYSYQWLADDTEIDEATNSTYTLQASDERKTIKVRVTFTDDAGNDESLTSAAMTTVEATVPGVPRSIEAERGGTAELDVSWEEPASNGGSPVTGYTVQWKEASDSWDSVADVSQTTTTDTSRIITGLSLGTEYTVRVIATNSVGDGPASAEASATADAQTSQQRAATQNSPATGAPTISGTAQVGQTLTATTSNIADSDGLVNAVYGYQWVRNDGGTDAEMQGATGSTYTLDAADEGKTVKVRVSFTDDAGNEETLTSAATGEVEARPNSPATGQPTIGRDGAGGRNADRGHVGHRRRRRAEQRGLRIPVARRRRGDCRGDGLDLHPGGGRRGQDHQGEGVLHRRLG